MILITGGTGFLGSHLIFEMLKSGEAIRVMRRPGSRMNILKRVFQAKDPAMLGKLDLIEWVEGDVLDVFSLEEAMQGIKDVYHCAAVVSFQSARRSEMLRVNGEGTANVVNVALKMHIRKLCYVSSIAALGRGGTEAVINEDSIWKSSPQNSGYAVSKYTGEREIWRGIEEGLDAVIVNPAIILGYGEENAGTATMFKLVNQGLPFYPVGINGYVIIDDVIKAILGLMKSEIKNERFVLSAENLSYKTLLEMIAGNLGKRPPYIKAGWVFMGIGWRLEWLRSSILRNKPIITKELAQTSLFKYNYEGQKIVKNLGFVYTSISEGLRTIAGQFQNNS